MEKLAVSGSLSILDSNIIMMSGQHTDHLIPLRGYLPQSSTNQGLGPPTLTPPLSHISKSFPQAYCFSSLACMQIYALLLASPWLNNLVNVLTPTSSLLICTADVKSRKWNHDCGSCLPDLRGGCCPGLRGGERERESCEAMFRLPSFCMLIAPFPYLFKFPFSSMFPALERMFW